jgi:hypothetical protein
MLGVSDFAAFRWASEAFDPLPGFTGILESMSRKVSLVRTRILGAMRESTVTIVEFMSKALQRHVEPVIQIVESRTICRPAVWWAMTFRLREIRRSSSS